MPRKKKHPKDWTTEEAMKKLFPKKVRDTLKQEAVREPNPQVKWSERSE
jgi:hypothetical protein